MFGIQYAIEAAVCLILTFLASFAATFVSLLLYVKFPFGLALPVILAINAGSIVLLYMILEIIVGVSRKWAH
jgi:hypothetical protein